MTFRCAAPIHSREAQPDNTVTKFGRPFDVVSNNCVDIAFKEAGFEEITRWNFKVDLPSVLEAR